MPKKYELPKVCPPELRAVVEKVGGLKVDAVRALGVSKEMFTKVAGGRENMPASWAEKIERVMRGEGPAVGPKFVSWDGKKVTFSTPGRNGAKKRTFKNVPAPVVELIEKHDGVVSRAARAAGTTGNTIMSLLIGDTEFNDKRQRMIFSGLHGIPLSASEDGGPDQYALGMAIVQVASKNYDRVADVADLLGGRLIFRTSTPVGWLAIYKLKADDAIKFKRLVDRDCSKVVCP